MSDVVVRLRRTFGVSSYRLDNENYFAWCNVCIHSLQMFGSPSSLDFVRSVVDCVVFLQYHAVGGGRGGGVLFILIIIFIDLSACVVQNISAFMERADKVSDHLNLQLKRANKKKELYVCITLSL